MHIFALALSVLAPIALSDCSAQSSASGTSEPAAAETESMSAAGWSRGLAADPSAGCMASLRAEVDKGSFESITTSPRDLAKRLEKLRLEAERLFKKVGNRMCASGELPAREFASLRRLLVQNGSGADNTAIYRDTEKFGSETLVFQYVFVTGDEAGTLALPEEADLREGLLCHFAAEANEAMCADRLP